MTAVTPYEVEIKYRVGNAAELRQALSSLGVELGPVELQVDQFYQHPSRNFVQTDEALRLRTIGDQTVLTYKGPVVDRRTKTRQELEVLLEPGHASAVTMSLILTQLGFPAVREVRKERRSGSLNWQDHQVICCWDEVPGIGTFVEFEIVTDGHGRTAAQDIILSLAAHCGLTVQEQRSYLQMNLDRDREFTSVEPG
ncbi:class IV adenylate cyclase [bacterium]|nr:class IV adenylate cyclase [bacterium]